METIPFPVTGLESNDIDTFMAAYAALKTTFDPTFDLDFALPVSDYFLFKQYHLVHLREAINLHMTGDVFIAFLLIGYNSGSARGAKHQEYQAWGVVTLKDDFGHVLIKDKSLGDIVLNMLQHTEVEFPEDKSWSHRFCVLADDRNKAGLAINAAFRAALMNIDIPDFTIEIIGNRLLIGNHKQINPGQTLRMARLLVRLGGL